MRVRCRSRTPEGIAIEWDPGDLDPGEGISLYFYCFSRRIYLRVDPTLNYADGKEYLRLQTAESGKYPE